jgi:5-methylcytosine-specific restriction endonuclease McrA
MTILERYDNRCAYCWSVGEQLTPDHVIPLARGGTNWARNVVPACLSCNRRKGIRPVVEFLLAVAAS